MASSSTSMIEKRLRDVERQLGLDDVESDKDIATRLARLESMWQEKVRTTPRLQATNADWIESLQKIQELDPGTALTHQQQIAAPFLYRRQEVIASSSDLSESFDRLSTIMSLLLIGQDGSAAAASKTAAGKIENISASQVTNAPILVEPRVSDDDVVRLSALAETLGRLQERVDETTQALDRILHQYSTMVNEIAEKTVLIDSELVKRGV